MSGGAGPDKKTFAPTVDATTSAQRSRSEVATLVLAAMCAVALGVACGFWVNARLASAANASRAARPRTAPAAPTPAGEAGAPPVSTETADATAAKAEPAVTAVEANTSKPAATPAPAPAARGASRQPKVEVSTGTSWEVVKRAPAERGQGRAAPCALYASAGSLNVRGGGAAPLILGGPGEAGHVAVSTPDWSNIAVLYEGRAGNGWLRYSVRSVSGRPGAYTVRFATPCGSKTIPVTVTR